MTVRCHFEFIPSCLPRALALLYSFSIGRADFTILLQLYHSLCNTTIKPIIPSMTCFSHGCSLSRMVTYPTKGMKPTTLPITSSLRLRNDWPCA